MTRHDFKTKTVVLFQMQRSISEPIKHNPHLPSAERFPKPITFLIWPKQTAITTPRYIPMTPCAPTGKCLIPCQNGGRCRGVNHCRCRAGYRGDHCEVVARQRCRRCRHGLCVAARCECRPGWYGRRCNKRKRGRGAPRRRNRGKTRSQRRGRKQLACE